MSKSGLGSESDLNVRNDGAFDRDIGAQLSFGSVLGSFYESSSGIPKESGSDNKCNRCGGKNGSQLDKPSVELGFLFAFFGLVSLFFLSGIRYGLYVDSKRKLLGASLICGGLSLASSGRWNLLVGWGI